MLTPGLMKNRLLTQIGSMGDVYTGSYNGQEVIIKQVKHPSAVAEIRKELRFLREHTEWSMVSPMTEYGIPLEGWSVKTHFIRPVDQAISQDMEEKGIIVVEPAKGKTLMENDESANFTLPFKFHFAAIMGWLHALKELKKENFTMDSNIDSDLFIEPDLTRRVLNVTKVDCVPINPSDRSTSSINEPIPEAWRPNLIDRRFINLENNVTSQIIDSMSIMYTHTFFEFLGRHTIQTLRPRFADGNIQDIDGLMSLLRNRLARVEWSDEAVVRGDNSRLRSWKDQAFE